MKYLLCLAMLFSFPLSAQEKGPFDNWLFKFLEGESEIVITYWESNGDKLNPVSGKVITTIDRKNNRAISTVVVKSVDQKENVAGVTTFSPKGKHTYSGVSKYPNGEQAKFTMTLQNEKHYRIRLQTPEGITASSNGKLKDESTIEWDEILRDKDGSLLLRTQITYKRAKKPVKKE